MADLVFVFNLTIIRGVFLYRLSLSLVGKRIFLHQFHVKFVTTILHFEELTATAEESSPVVLFEWILLLHLTDLHFF
jgi:hypothetical protein